MRLTPLFIILLLSLAIPSLRAEKSETPPPPTDCYQRYLRMPSADLLRHAERFRKKGTHPDSAMLCFTIVAERIEPQMTRRQKEECFSGWCGRWEVNNWSYNNYEACMRDYEKICQLQHQWAINSARPLYYRAIHETYDYNIDPEVSDINKVIRCYKEAFNKAIKLKDGNIASRSLMALINVCFFKNSDSLINEKEKLEALLPENDRTLRTVQLKHSAMRYNQEGRHTMAIKSIDKLISLYDTATLDHPSARNYTSDNCTRAVLLQGKHLYPEAIKAWLKVIGLTYRYNLKELRQSALVMLARIYRDLNQYELLEQVSHHSIMLKDSIWNARFTRGLSQIRFDDAHREIQRQMAVMEYRQKVLRWVILGAVVVIVCFILFIWSLRRTNRKLRERTEALYDRINAAAPVGAHHDANAVGAHHGAPENTPADAPEMVTNADADTRAHHGAPLQTAESPAMDAGTPAAESSEMDADTRAHHDAPLQTADPDTNTTAPRQIMQPDVRDRLAAEIDKVMTRTEAPFSGDFSLTRLAQSVGSNTRYVSHVINEVFGSNFQTYVNSVRIREACRRIDDHSTYGNYSTEAIGETVGFNSRSAFATAFKKITGLTPSEYRKISIQRAKKAKR